MQSAEAQSIGDRRRALGLSGVAVAEALGINPVVYSRWERGRDAIPPARVPQLELLFAEYEAARERVRAGLERSA